MLAFCALDHVELHAISTGTVTVWSGFNFQSQHQAVMALLYSFPDILVESITFS